MDEQLSSESHSRRLTSDVVAVVAVDLLHAAVAEGQLAHPVHPAPHPRGKTQVGVVGGGVEAVGGKVVIAAQTTGKRSRSGVEVNR